MQSPGRSRFRADIHPKCNSEMGQLWVFGDPDPFAKASAGPRVSPITAPGCWEGYLIGIHLERMMNTNYLLSLASLTLALALAACDNSGSSVAGPNGDTGNKVAPTAGMGARMVPVSITDPMINNNKAFTFLVPFGWNYQAKVEWHQEYENLASANVVISNPNNGDLGQIYPFIPFVWNPNNFKAVPGTIYIGGYVMAPVQDPSVFVQQIVFPAYRQGMGNVQVIGNTPLADVAQSIWKNTYAGNPNYSVTASALTVRYDFQGRSYDETFYCALNYATDPALPGAVLWRPEFIFSTRAFAGELQNGQGMIAASLTSVNVDMKWFAAYLQVHKLWQDGQMAAIKSEGELSRYLSGVNASVSSDIVDGYNQRQASQDKVYEKFSESIRGVETYSNPSTSDLVQLPAGYSNVWVNTSGEYFLSNEAGVDPNVGSVLSYTQLTPED